MPISPFRVQPLGRHKGYRTSATTQMQVLQPCGRSPALITSRLHGGSGISHPCTARCKQTLSLLISMPSSSPPYLNAQPEEGGQQSLMGPRQGGEASLVGQEQGGGHHHRLDWLPSPSQGRLSNTTWSAMVPCKTAAEAPGGTLVHGVKWQCQCPH